MKYWVRAVSERSSINEQLLVSSRTAWELQLELASLLHVELRSISLTDAQVAAASRDTSGDVIAVRVVTRNEVLEETLCAPQHRPTPMQDETLAAAADAGCAVRLTRRRSAQHIRSGSSDHTTPQRDRTGSVSSGGVAAAAATGSVAIVGASGSTGPGSGSSTRGTSPTDRGPCAAPSPPPAPPGGPLSASPPASTTAAALGATGAPSAVAVSVPPPEPSATIADVTLTREALSSLIALGFNGAFHAAVEGCFVRVRAPRHSAPDHPPYCLARIAAVHSDTQLLLDLAVMAELRHIDAVSNAPPSVDEMRAWFRQFIAARREPPSVEVLAEKSEDVRAATLAAAALKRRHSGLAAAAAAEAGVGVAASTAAAPVPKMAPAVLAAGVGARGERGGRGDANPSPVPPTDDRSPPPPPPGGGGPLRASQPLSLSPSAIAGAAALASAGSGLGAAVSGPPPVAPLIAVAAGGSCSGTVAGGPRSLRRRNTMPSPEFATALRAATTNAVPTSVSLAHTNDQLLNVAVVRGADDRYFLFATRRSNAALTAGGCPPKRSDFAASVAQLTDDLSACAWDRDASVKGYVSHGPPAFWNGAHWAAATVFDSTGTQRAAVLLSGRDFVALHYPPLPLALPDAAAAWAAAAVPDRLAAAAATATTGATAADGSDRRCHRLHLVAVEETLHVFWTMPVVRGGRATTALAHADTRDVKARAWRLRSVSRPLLSGSGPGGGMLFSFAPCLAVVTPTAAGPGASSSSSTTQHPSSGGGAGKQFIVAVCDDAPLGRNATIKFFSCTLDGAIEDAADRRLVFSGGAGVSDRAPCEAELVPLPHYSVPSLRSLEDGAPATASAAQGRAASAIQSLSLFSIAAAWYVGVGLRTSFTIFPVQVSGSAPSSLGGSPMVNTALNSAGSTN